MEFIDQYEAFINDCKHRLFEKFKISKDEFKKYLETIVEERKQCWFKTNGKLLLKEYHDFGLFCWNSSDFNYNVDDYDQRIDNS